jgi:uncharacterized membrane protein
MSISHLLKVSRLEGLTDGIFAIAMTILVLDLQLPKGIPNSDLTLYLFSSVSIRLAVYVGSFIILGTLWVSMNFQLGLLERVNRPYLWANIFYLLVICVIPFSASIVAEYPYNKTSIIFFAINLLFTTAGQTLTIACADNLKLNKEIYTPAIRKAILKRIALAPAFYISAIILSYWNTSIAFIALVAPPLLYIFPGKIDRYDG